MMGMQERTTFLNHLKTNEAKSKNSYFACRAQ